MSRIVETITKQIEPDPWITDAEVENLCCEAVKMPPCREKTEPWNGYTQEEILERLHIVVDEHGRDDSGNIVEVRLKNDNPSGRCGEQLTKQVEKPKSCCDGVSAIVWDGTHSVEVIADNSNGYVYVTGGRPPYTWSVRGNGFWLNSVGTVRDAETDEPWIRIFTSNSCGGAEVTVSDGCSEVTSNIKTTVGSWYLIGEFNSDEPSLLKEHFADIFTDISNGYSGVTSIPVYAESGIYMISESGSAPFDTGKTYDWTTWGRFQGSACKYRATVEYYPDPVLGIFMVPGINSYINVGTSVNCGGGTKYRVTVYRPSIDSLKVYRWQC